MFGFEGDGAGLLAEEFGDKLFFRFDGVGAGAVVVADVTAGTEDALLLASPERDTDGAARLQVKSGQDTHGFDRDDGTGAVVRGACAGDPAIEVASEHHDLVFECWIRAWNFG